MDRDRAVRHVLILNSGSSSLKWSVLDVADAAIREHGTHTWVGGGPTGHLDAIRTVLADLRPVDAVGHRVVHGGAVFQDAVVVDRCVRDAIAALADLAPLHNPAAVAGIDAVSAAHPGLPQVAAFDTAFHVTIPEAAARYALPWAWSEGEGELGGTRLRRFGFHGLSLAHAVSRAAATCIPARSGPPSRMVVCHLGAGCSISAVSGGRSVDTTMGFTPLDGVMMAMRPGAMDPGLLIYLLRRGISVDRLDQALQGGAGLLGVSGVSADLRAVRSAALAGDPRAALACAMFIHQIVRAVGSMIAVLGGVDALVFTGGVGEHAAWVREDVAAAFAFAGVHLDAAANAACDGDADVATPDAAVRILVIEAREDLQILAAMRRVLGDPRP
jgi:acetate kinase